MQQAAAVEAERLATRFLHLFALCGFAIAQPLFALLAPNPTFFVAHDASATQVVLLAMVASLLVPLVFTALVASLRVLSPGLARGAYFTLAALLVTLVLLPPLGRWLPDWPWAVVGIAAPLGAGFALLLRRSRALAMFLGALALVALVFPLNFLLASTVRGLLGGDADTPAAGANNGTPVVMVVFDEFPLTALMTPALDINRERFPAFAALADTAHWFRNASTVAYFTDQAVPAILTGRYPGRAGDKPGQPPAPVRANFPHNLFALLADSHDIRSFESITALAPALAGNSRFAGLSERRRQQLYWLDTAIVYANIVAPPGLVPALPDLNGQWLDFSNALVRWNSTPPRSPDLRAERVLQFMDSIEPAGARPPLHFLHVILPHMPLVFLPSGRYYGPQPLYPHGMTKASWSDDPWEAAQGYQRFLLQLGYVDRLLGDIVARLEDAGLYDQALVVVTGDHGQSYREGTEPRRIGERNLADTLLVPLFIKLPGQAAGQVSDANVETVDILPTIAGVLESEAGWSFDGSDLFAAAPPRAGKRAWTRAVKELDFPAVPPGLATALQRNRDQFGDGGWEGVYRAGPGKELLGRPLADFDLGAPADFSVALERESAFAGVDLASDSLPALLRGEVHPPPAMGRQALAIALNGTLAATTWTYTDDRSRGGFTAALPENLFRQGANRLEVFALGGPAEGQRLQPVRVEQQDRAICPGEVLDFRRGSYDPRWQVGGLAPPEAGHTWSNAPFVQFEFDLAGARDEARLQVRLAPFLASGRIAEQVVEVRVDGAPVARWVLDRNEATDFTATIPAAVVRRGNFLLEFRLPNAAVPKDLGLGGDLRLLAVRFVTLRFEVPGKAVSDTASGENCKRFQ